MKAALVEAAEMRAGMRILDVGCGTGTLTILMSEACPGVTVTGLDGDPRVLATARRKAPDLPIHWDAGFASQLPYPDAEFDRVVSSLVIHHLDTFTKHLAFAEARRVLKPDGVICVLDFADPQTTVDRLISAGLRHLEETADNIDGRLPEFIADAGFSTPVEVARFRSIFGPVAILRAEAR